MALPIYVTNWRVSAAARSSEGKCRCAPLRGVWLFTVKLRLPQLRGVARASVERWTSGPNPRYEDI